MGKSWEEKKFGKKWRALALTIVGMLVLLGVIFGVRYLGGGG